MNDFSFSTAALASVADDSWQLRTARILAPAPEAGAGRYRISRPGGEASALRAAGCLLEPAPGDLVLIAVGETEDPYILNVLTRASAAPCTLAALDGGPIALKGARIDLTAGTGLSLTAPQLAVTTDEAAVAFRKASLVGKGVFAALDRIETVAQEVMAFAHRSVETIGTLVRRVQNQEVTSARQVVQQVDETLTIQATHAAIVARDQMRIDGERITMG